MPDQGITQHLRGCLFAVPFIAVLLSGMVPGTSFGDGCWILSGTSSSGGSLFPISEDPVYPICQGNDICVEWESAASQALATDCCSQPPSFCENPCTSVGDRPIPIVVDIFPEAPQKDTSEIRHVVPKASILVDQVELAPEEIHRFDGVALYFLVCRRRDGQLLPQALSTKEGFFDQLGECRQGRSSFIVQEAPARAEAGVAFFEGPRWSGAPYFLAPGQSFVLDQTWWDDRITSLRGFGTGTMVTLFENADFSGSSLTLSTDLGWPDLSVLGWQGRASALVVWPAPSVGPKPLP